MIRWREGKKSPLVVLKSCYSTLFTVEEATATSSWVKQWRAGGADDDQDREKGAAERGRWCWWSMVMKMLVLSERQQAEVDDCYAVDDWEGHRKERRCDRPREDEEQGWWCEENSCCEKMMELLVRRRWWSLNLRSSSNSKRTRADGVAGWWSRRTGKRKWWSEARSVYGGWFRCPVMVNEMLLIKRKEGGDEMVMKRASAVGDGEKRSWWWRWWLQKWKQEEDRARKGPRREKERKWCILWPELSPFKAENGYIKKIVIIIIIITTLF